MHVIPIAGSAHFSVFFGLFWFGCGGVFGLPGFFCFWLWVFGFLLDSSRIGPLPVLLWLSASRQPCRIITIHFFAPIERV